jgi:hypothetical protein
MLSVNHRWGPPVTWRMHPTWVRNRVTGRVNEKSPKCQNKCINFTVEKSSQKIWALPNFQNTARSKLLSKSRKFAKSGHPGLERQFSSGQFVKRQMDWNAFDLVLLHLLFMLHFFRREWQTSVIYLYFYLYNSIFLPMLKFTFLSDCWFSGARSTSRHEPTIFRFIYVSYCHMQIPRRIVKPA